MIDIREREKPTLVHSGARVFNTPFCDFYIADENNGEVTFDIFSVPQKTVYVGSAHDKSEKTASELDGNYSIRIATDKLSLMKSYYIRCTRQLSYRDADERLLTYGITTETSTLAVSFPNPNDDKKSLGCPECDYEGFDIKPENGEFVLHVFDRTHEYIYIAVAWLTNIGEDTDMASCESAVDVATWWI